MSQNLPSVRGADRDTWLGLAVARHGTPILDRLVKSLPADQAADLRLQLEAFVYELELADAEASRTKVSERPPSSAKAAVTTPVAWAKKPAARAVKAKPATQSKPASGDDQATILEKWKKPAPLAVAGVVALALVYLYFPSNLFGNARSYAVHPAKGEASFEGKPIPNASIILYPINPSSDNHPRPKAAVGPDGRFALGTYGTDDGAPAGEYKVSIVWNAPPTPQEIRDDRYRPRNLLPARYANPDTSGLTVRIAAGDNRLPAFVLKRKG
jgi:hypothetical protein